jgi:hypothetical protein
MRTIFAILMLAPFAPGNPVAAAEEVEPISWTFEDAEMGQLPNGWTMAQTGEGKGSEWKVIVDDSAPGGSHALAQLAAGPRPLFNLCVVDEVSSADLEIAVAFKAVAGKIDQGGGVVWRYQDADNYYITRYNPLEKNLRLYKVVAGERTQLATKEDLDAPAGEWHTLAVKMEGNAIECSLNGEPQLEAKDETFQKAGKIGLWTKADAQTHFDQLEVKAAQ